MTFFPQKFCRVITVMTMACIVMLSGCQKGIKDDIEDLQGRVSSLEALTKALDAQLKAGSLLKSATPLDGGNGWTLEFSNGTIVTVENGGQPGANAITPQIEVRRNTGGEGYSLWYNVTKGYPASGWINTGVNIQGPAGNGSGNGNGGSTLDLRSYGGYIQYTTIENPTASDWQNLFPVPTNGTNGADGLSNISAFFTDNENGTVTLVLGDGRDYVFEIYKEIPYGLVFLKALKKDLAGAITFPVTFRVNPSTVDALQYDLAKWTVSEIGTTRASYTPTPSPAFTLTEIKESQAGFTGEYIATLTPVVGTYSAFTEYSLALVLEADDDLLLSSGSFVVKNGLPLAPLAWVVDLGIGRDKEGVVENTDGILLLNIGEETTLSPMFINPTQPDDTTVVWAVTLGDDSIIEFNETTGALKALAPGTATVTLTSNFTGGAPKVVTLTITVAPNWATDIELDQTVLNSKIGDPDVQLIATVTSDLGPVTNDAVTWVSSDDTVATVSATGLVTIVGQGTATITAKAVGSDPEEDAVIAECVVNVTPVWATDITIDHGTLSMEVGDDPVILTATVTADEGTPTDTSVTWVSSNDAVASVDPATGAVTPLGIGTTTIKAIANGSEVAGDVYATCEVSVTAPTSITIVNGDDLFGFVLKSAEEMASVTGNGVGQLWNVQVGTGGGSMYNNNNDVADWPAGGVINIEDQLEAASPGIDFTVSYTKVGQYGWLPSASNWVEETNANLLADITDNTIEQGTTSTINNGVGDRLVIEVTVSAAIGSVPVEIDPSVFYICVELP